MKSYTPKVNKILSIAQDVAEEKSSDYVGIEELLVAIIRAERSWDSRKYLSSSGVTEESILSQIAK